jgi:hypothetical protein
MENKMADTLNRRVTLLFVMSVEVTRFERLKEKYESRSKFREVYMTLRDENNRVVDSYHLKERYLY